VPQQQQQQQQQQRQQQQLSVMMLMLVLMLVMVVMEMMMVPPPKGKCSAASYFSRTRSYGARSKVSPNSSRSMKVLRPTPPGARAATLIYDRVSYYYLGERLQRIH
jgi:cytochrome c oxidase assembly protein Cox11